MPSLFLFFALLLSLLPFQAYPSELKTPFLLTTKLRISSLSKGPCASILEGTFDNKAAVDRELLTVFADLRLQEELCIACNFSNLIRYPQPNHHLTATTLQALLKEMKFHDDDELLISQNAGPKFSGLQIESLQRFVEIFRGGERSPGRMLFRALSMDTLVIELGMKDKVQRPLNRIWDDSLQHEAFSILEEMAASGDLTHLSFKTAVVSDFLGLPRRIYRDTVATETVARLSSSKILSKKLEHVGLKEMRLTGVDWDSFFKSYSKTSSFDFYESIFPDDLLDRLSSTSVQYLNVEAALVWRNDREWYLQERDLAKIRKIEKLEGLAISLREGLTYEGIRKLFNGNQKFVQLSLIFPIADNPDQDLYATLDELVRHQPTLQTLALGFARRTMIEGLLTQLPGLKYLVLPGSRNEWAEFERDNPRIQLVSKYSWW